MKNILITGASGFIGSFIVEEALKKGLSVWAGVRPTSSKAYLKQEELHFISFDFDDSDKLREQLLLFKQQEGGFDYIVHCAGVTKCVHQSDFDRVNYWQTKRFVDLLCELQMVPTQFIHISTLSVFGPIHEETYQPIVEQDKPQPNTAYGMSKLKAEQHLQQLPDFPYVILRPTGVYGPRERDYFMMAQSIKKHLDFSVGYKKQDLTFIYVKDIVQAVFLAIEKGVKQRSYFLSDGKVYSSRTFSELIQKELCISFVIRIKCPLIILKVISLLAEFFAGISGKSSTLNSDKFKIMKQRNWQCDITPLVNELGYKPEFDLQKGVKETIAWYKKEGWL
ncbi:MAG: NAD(P)-dependent oxidoreductase [Bacteroides graminisolvens]|mgnify:FL=1|jgi:dihydroflavonol-4-reductase